MASDNTPSSAIGTKWAARYAGTCGDCDARIAAGQRVCYRYPGKILVHADCPVTASAEEPAAPATPATATTIHLHGGSGYGDHGWAVGQVIVSGEQRRRAGGPDGLVVLAASRRYVREEGTSFGVGDDQGYLYSATCRAATAAELAPVIDGLCGQAYRASARAELARGTESIQIFGERPERLTEVEGEEIVVQARTGYGHGQEIVIGTEWISYVRGNGSDGDDWSHNNYAGSIVWRVPYSAEFATRLRTLAARGA